MIAVTFHTTTQAMAFDSCATKKGFPGELAPIPKALCAGCGFSWIAQPEDAETLKARIEEEGLGYQEIAEF